MKKQHNITYIICFLLILFIPLLLTNTKQNVVSGFDNRVLVEFPEIGSDKYEDKIELYLQDRIGLRDQMVTGYQYINNLVANELTHPLYTYGKNGYVFFKMHNNIQFNDYHNTFAEAVLKMKEYCESRGSKFYFMFDPEKLSVYRQYLPDGVNYDDQWVDEMLSYMESLGIKCVNNKAMLTELSTQEQVFNVKYDAGHWNDLGCFYATNNLWRTIQQDFPNVTEYSKEEFDIGTGVGKFLASSHFPVNEEIPSYRLKTRWSDITSAYYAIKLNKNYSFFQYYINSAINSEDLPRMLVFQGSYYNRSPQFLAGRAKEYIAVHNYQNVLDLDYYFNIFHPDLVVFEAAEYTFLDTYFDSAKMAGLEFSPCLADSREDVAKATESAMNEALLYLPADGSDLYVIPSGGIDKVYTEVELSSARFIYLLTDYGIFDIKKDIYGTLSADIPHGSISETAYIYFLDNSGKAYYYALTIKQGAVFTDVEDSFSYSEGARYDATSHQYEVITNLNGNRFSMVNMQLLDEGGNYLDPVYSAYWTGTFSGSYTHNKPTGRYVIRLKGNTNKKDEGIDVSVYLVYGQTYYYSFDIPVLSRKRVVIKNYDFYGPCSEDK